MTRAFNFNRFAKLLKMEVQSNKKIFIQYSFYMFVIVNCLFPLKFAGNTTFITMEEFSNYSDLIIAMVKGVTIAIPLLVYRYLYDSQKDVHRAMFPASQLEKIISAIIQVSFILPFLLFIISITSLNVISYIKYSEFSVNYIEHFQSLFFVLQAQSFVFLTVFLFRDNKHLKIILTAIVFLILLIIVVNRYESVWASWINTLTQDIFIDNSNLKKIGTIIFNILVPLVPWILSYRQLKKTEISGYNYEI